MKSGFLICAFMALAISVIAQTQPGRDNTLSPARGHYRKLSTFSATPQKGMEKTDVLRFQSETTTPAPAPEAAITSGPSESAKNKPPTSACDPEACQAEVIGNGRKRTPHYLSGKEKFKIDEPPANSSKQTRAELDYLLQLQSQRTEEDVRASLFYAGVYYRTGVQPGDAGYEKFQRNLFHIGRSIGTWFHPDSLPVTAKLAANVWKDTEYNIWKYKNCYMRIRPYKLETKLENKEETNWAAYPSGHATNSYMNAFLFASLIPEFTDFFMKDAYDMAHSREIIGVHYPSDSESGRQLAFAVLQELKKSEQFRKDWNAAKEEIRKARTAKGF
jgi:acid phosphatase (class A)